MTDKKDTEELQTLEEIQRKNAALKKKREQERLKKQQERADYYKRTSKNNK